jgi:hypothetical protein
LLRVRALKVHAFTSNPWLQGLGLAVFLIPSTRASSSR